MSAPRTRQGPGWQLLDAAREGMVDTVEKLVQEGAAVEGKSEFGRTPLHLASFFGHAAVIRCLLAAGASVNAEDGWGGTPLHMAAASGHSEAAKLLLASGANPAARTYGTETAEMFARRRGHEDVAELLRAAAQRDLAGDSTASAPRPRRPPRRRGV